jgi:hypothetical protein
MMHVYAEKVAPRQHAVAGDLYLHRRYANTRERRYACVGVRSGAHARLVEGALRQHAAAEDVHLHVLTCYACTRM